jgi:hypothetical protein
MRFLPTMTRSLAIRTTLDVSVGKVGADMPGVNRICNTKMSHLAADFELFLRSGASLRNFPHFLAKRHGDCAAVDK